MPYITPDSIPTDKVYRLLAIPNDTLFLGAVNGALLVLEEIDFWEQVEGVTVEDAAQAASIMIERYWDIPMLLGSIQAVATATNPDNTIPCDGSTYLRVDYPSLYAVMHTDFIIDADHFKTPTLNTAASIHYCMVAK